MRLLITEPSNFDTQALAMLKTTGARVDCIPCDYEKLAAIIGDYDGIILRLGIHIDAPLLQRASRLRFISTLTTGVNHIDIDEVQRRGIIILSLRDERKFLDTITPTAELTIGLVLEIYRHLTPAQQAVWRGTWDRTPFIGHEINHKRLGVVGLGRLGTMVAKLGSAFGAEILYIDPEVQHPLYRRCHTLFELASMADIISIHVPLSAKTTHLIDADFFAHCQPHAVLINTSRGQIIDEPALLDALRNRRIAGAGLDVLANEVGYNPIKNPLINYARQHDNLVITPHIGGATYEAMRAVEHFMAEKIIDHLAVAQPA